MSTRVRGKFQKLRASKFEYSGPATCAVLNESALKKKNLQCNHDDSFASLLTYW